MKKVFFVFLAGMMIFLSGCGLLEKVGITKEREEVKPGSVKIGEIPVQEQTAESDEGEPVKSISAILKTNKGDIKIDFFPQEAPRTVMNFANLARTNFYDGTKFHRVVKDFMIQGGDPNSKDEDKSDDGKGGPGYAFEDEINPKKLQGLEDEDIKKLEAEGYVYNYNLPSSHNVTRGMVAMANSGPKTNGSQFFIVTAEAAPWLDGRHTVFGEVAEGMEVVLGINNVEVENEYPKEDIVIQDIVIIINGKEYGEINNETATTTTEATSTETSGATSTEQEVATGTEQNGATSTEAATSTGTEDVGN